MTQHITLSGHLGAGKSTVAKLLERRMPEMTRLYTGAIFREAAREKGMSVRAFNAAIKAGDIQEDIDARIDGEVATLVDGDKPHIFDSRLAWMNAPGDKALKVMMIVHPLEAARRVFSEDRAEEKYSNEEDALAQLQARYRAETERFNKLYGLDLHDYDNFDLVIDTTCGDPETTAAKIQECYERKLIGEPFPKFWVSPQNIFSRQVSHGGVRIDEENVLYLTDKIFHEGFDEDTPIEIGRIGGYNFIFEGHHRGVASILNDKGLIPAEIYRENEVPEGYHDIVLNMLFDTDGPATPVYDWEDIVKYFASSNSGIEKRQKISERLPVLDHLTNFRIWTRADDPDKTPFPLTEDGRNLDFATIAKQSWEGYLRSHLHLRPKVERSSRYVEDVAPAAE